jgi:hypothetical protein
VRARAALEQTKAKSWPTILTGVDSSAILNGGRLVLRGYAIDLDDPDDGAHVAVEQGGALIGFDRMTRMRPKIAEAVSRPDISKVRFGFGVVTDLPLNCAHGPLTVKVVLSKGKVALVHSDLARSVCSKAGG